MRSILLKMQLQGPYVNLAAFPSPHQGKFLLLRTLFIAVPTSGLITAQEFSIVVHTVRHPIFRNGQ